MNKATEKYRTLLSAQESSNGNTREKEQKIIK